MKQTRKMSVSKTDLNEASRALARMLLYMSDEAKALGLTDVQADVDNAYRRLTTHVPEAVAALFSHKL
jgi:hypothetical protein